MEKNLPVPAAANLQRRLDFLMELALVLVLVISPFLLGSVGMLAVTIIELGAFLILFLWFFKSIIEGSVNFVHLPLNKFIILFLLFVLLQYIFVDFFIYEFALGEIYREKMKKEALRLISCLIFFYTAINNFKERKKISRLISILLCIGFILSFFGIIQKLSGAKNIFWVGPLQKGETFFASFPNRNHFANYINMTIFLALGAIFSRFPALRDEMRGLGKTRLVKAVFATFQTGVWLYMTALVVMTSALFFSLSRGGIFAFVCGLVFFSAVLLSKGITKRGHAFLLVVLVFTLAMLIWMGAPEQIMKRFSRVDNIKAPLIERALGGRKIFASKALGLIKEYPLVGVGLGAFEFIYNKKYSPRIMYVENVYYYIDHLHNDFLEFFCEVGLVGFIIFATAACLYGFFTIKTLWKRHDPFAIGIGTGAMAGLFSMCVHSLFDFNFHITSNAVLFSVVAGLGIVVSNSQIKTQKDAAFLSARPLLIKNSFHKIMLSVILTAVFFYAVKRIVNPYIAYGIAQDKKADAVYLKKAIRLDPKNDNYHFMLSRLLIAQAKINKENVQENMNSAVTHIKEAIRLNPWNEYYPTYLEWINSTSNE